MCIRDRSSDEIPETRLKNINGTHAIFKRFKKRVPKISNACILSPKRMPHTTPRTIPHISLYTNGTLLYSFHILFPPMFCTLLQTGISPGPAHPSNPARSPVRRVHQPLRSQTAGYSQGPFNSTVISTSTTALSGNACTPVSYTHLEGHEERHGQR